MKPLTAHRTKQIKGGGKWHYAVKVTYKSDKPFGTYLTKKEADELVRFIEAMPEVLRLAKENAYNNLPELNVIIDKL